MSTDSRADRPKARFGLWEFAALIIFSGAFALWTPQLKSRYQAWQLERANEQLLMSAAQADLDGVSEAIAAGADVQARVVPGGRTALYYAVDRGDQRLLERLLRAGAAPDQTFLLQPDDTPTALEVAVRRGRIDLARRLVELGADPDGPTPRNGVPLILSAALGNVEMAETLLGLGADVNAQSSVGFLKLPGKAARLQLADSTTPLYAAVTARHQHPVRLRIVRLLLERGAAPLSETLAARAMDRAAYLSDGQLADLLRECGIEPGPREAAALNKLDEIKRLVHAQPSILTTRYRPLTTRYRARGQTLLGVALHQGSSEVARFLIEKGAPLDGIEGSGQTMLHYAARGGDADLIRLLAARGLEVDARDDDHNTPLTGSLVWTSLEAVDALLDAGADVNAAGSGGLTPLHLAASCDRTDVMQLLLSRGADPAIPDDRGVTLIDDVPFSAKVRKILQEHGLSPGERGPVGETR